MYSEILSQKLHHHLPALYIIIPLFSCLTSIIISNKLFSRISFLISNFILLVLALYGFLTYSGPIKYAFGDWLQPFGIEFRYDRLAATSLVILSFFMFYCNLFTINAITNQVETLLKPGRKHLPLIIIGLFHFSAAGLILSNDLFNIYIFIEVFSLSAYSLIAISPNPKGYIGAFDYLLIGTIAATLILIGIGLFLTITGTLNLTDLKILFQHNSTIFVQNKLFIAGSILLIIGCLIKIAFIPFHWWQLRAYIYSSPVLVLYLLAVSNFVPMIILIKLLYLLKPYIMIQPLLICSFAIASVLIGAIMAYFQNEFRKILIYSTIGQVGYYFLLWPFNAEESFVLLFTMMIFDNFNKIGCLLFLISLNATNINPSIVNFTGLAKSNKMLCLGMCLLLANIAGLPITYGFINKIKVMEGLIKLNFYIAIIAILINSFLSILYNFKIGSQFFRYNKSVIHYKIDKAACIGTICCATLSIILLYNYNNIRLVSTLIFYELNDMSF